MHKEIHIGKLIRDQLIEDGHSVAWFARQLNCDRTNIYKIFNKPHVDTHQLLQISTILRHDFFLHYSQHLADSQKL